MSSQLERTWSARTEPGRLRCRRQDQFDMTSGLFYAPLEYSLESISAQQDFTPPDESTVTGLFTEFTRDEFNRVASEQTLPSPLLLDDAIDVNFRELTERLLASAEGDLVYGDNFSLLADTLAPLTLPEKFHELFCTDNFGQKDNRDNVSVDWFAKFLANRLDPRGGTWILTVPGLPFRDQNPFRCPDPPALVTLAEATFLARLHATSLAIFQIMSGGLHVVVLSDGTLYADTLLVEAKAAKQYLANVRELRDLLNISGTVSILDLRELAEDAAQAENHDFWSLVGEVEDILDYSRADPDWDGQSSLRNLVAGVRWNMNWRGLGDIPRDDVWEYLNCPPEAHIEEARYGETSREIVARSIRYAAINVVLRALAPIPKLLPDAMRATVHPKPGQIGLPRFGSVSPWNGVALIDSANGLPSVEKIQVHPTFRLAARGRRYVPLVDARKSDTPIGYVVVK